MGPGREWRDVVGHLRPARNKMSRQLRFTELSNQALAFMASGRERTGFYELAFDEDAGNQKVVHGWVVAPSAEERLIEVPGASGATAKPPTTHVRKEGQAARSPLSLRHRLCSANIREFESAGCVPLAAGGSGRGPRSGGCAARHAERLGDLVSECGCPSLRPNRISITSRSRGFRQRGTYSMRSLSR